MLEVKFYDGFTGELVSFDAVFSECICKITRNSIHGKVSDHSFSFSLDEKIFDLLSTLEVLHTLKERYEYPVDGVGSVTCTFKWNNKICIRYFSGYSISNCVEKSEDKKVIENFEVMLLKIREVIANKSHKID